MRVDRSQAQRQPIQAVVAALALLLPGRQEATVQVVQPPLPGHQALRHRRALAIVQMAQPRSLLVEQAGGPTDLQRQPVQPLRGLVEPALHCTTQHQGDGLQAGQRVVAQGRGQLGRRGRRRRAQVGRQFGQRDVGFMADPADHRQAAAGHGPHHRLVVESPQVFQRAAAAADDQRIDLVALIGLADRSHDLRRGLGALHAAGVDHQPHLRRPAFDRGDHVVQRRRPQRSDHPQRLRPGRQRPLTRQIEQSGGLQARAQLQKKFVERAFAQPRHRFDHALQFTARLVDGDAAAQLDLLAIGRAKVEQRGCAAKHRAAQQGRLAFAVFEREVAVAAGRAREARDLAAHRHCPQPRRQRIGHRQQQRGHGPGAGSGRRSRGLVHGHPAGPVRPTSTGPANGNPQSPGDFDGRRKPPSQN